MTRAAACVARSGASWLCVALALCLLPRCGETPDAARPAYIDDLPAVPASLAAGPAELADAVRAADSAARDGRGDSDNVGRLAMTYHANGWFDEAKQAYHLAATLDAQSRDWVYGQVLLAEDAGEIEPPFELLEEAVRLDPTFAPAWLRLGSARFKASAMQPAREALEQAVAHGEATGDGDDTESRRVPVSAYARLMLARLLVREGKLDEARSALLDAIDREPMFGPLHRLLAQVDESLGRSDDADWRRTLANAMRPHAPAPDALRDAVADLSFRREVLLVEAVNAGRAGMFGRKQALLERAQRLFPEDAQVRRQLEAVRLVREQRAKAVTDVVPSDDDAQQYRTGRQLFVMACAGCHGPDGLGQSGKAPPLATSRFMQAPEGVLARIVLDGIEPSSDGAFAAQMPSLRALEDDQLAAIIHHVRIKWGQGRANVSADDVAAIRRETAGRGKPWRRDELEAMWPTAADDEGHIDE